MSPLRLVLATIGAVLSLAGAASAEDLAIVSARVYATPDAAPMDAATILIHDGRIAAVGPDLRVSPPPGADIIDGRGKVVTAGFWNSHVHIFTHELLHADQRSAAELDAALDQMLNRWGFTSVFDVASILDNTNLIRARIKSSEVRGPMILTVGEPFFPLIGPPIYIRAFVAAEHVSFPQSPTIADAVVQEKREIAGGADGIKLFTGDIVGGPVGVEPMPLALAKALVAEAHRQGRPVFAHPTNLQGIQIALDSGVDILAHTTPEDGPWSAALIERLKAQHTALIPTLTLFEDGIRKDGASPAVVDRIVGVGRGQLRAYHDAGGEILFGTDVGYTDVFDTTEEYRLMAASGLDWRAILASLTTNPSRRFGFSARKGSIAPGMDADLTILDADPSTDVAAFAKVHTSISGGRVIYPAP